jgi:hypothetical protein
VKTKRTSAQVDWRNWASRSVDRAVRNGWLPDLSTREYECADCRGVADRWEHRDYSMVLDVEPVCHRCNMKRGRGRMPVFTRVFRKVVTEPVVVAHPDGREYLRAYISRFSSLVAAASHLGIPYPTFASVCNGTRGIGHDLALRMVAADPSLDASVLIWVRPIKPGAEARGESGCSQRDRAA